MVLFITPLTTAASIERSNCWNMLWKLQQIEIDDMQLGFMKGNGTTDAIFMARQMQDNFRVKGKKLYFGFVDLEKAFDRVQEKW